MNKLYRSLRMWMSNTARFMWQKLPLSIHNKRWFKNLLFTQFPFAFKWSKAYRSWVFAKARNVITVDSNKHEDIIFTPIVTSDTYVPLLQTLPPKDVPVKLIAFYLPQFHAIAENDEWWGKGFTEWSNVMPAQPQFEWHYQPHIPSDLGYYDLLDPAVQRRQTNLAKLHGVGGFCFYAYWFGGKRLLEKPIENYIKDQSLDLPFCLCWANENWSRRWDGLDNEILIAQSHSPEDDLAFIQHFSKYIKDGRYIRVDGKPLLLIYRPGLLPSAKETAKRWRKWCLQNGIGEIYLAYTQAFEQEDPHNFGFDAAIEFPPNHSLAPNVTQVVKPISDNFGGHVYDWQYFVEASRNYKKPAYKLFRSVCPSWDNTARRKNNGTIFANSSPSGYQEWLQNAIADTFARFENPNERLVFINAWNEWAEGAHLEPDQRYGYAYLEATRKALVSKAEDARGKKILVVSHDAHPHGAQFLALGIVRSLKLDLRLEVEVVLLGKGRLTSDFAELAPVHDLSEFNLESDEAYVLTESFVKRGFHHAIVNTTVSGGVIPIFSKADIKCLSLVHELPGVIENFQLENQTKQVAMYARAVVFPAQVVADGFSQFASLDKDKQFIRPQGLYRRNKWRFQKELARSKLRKQLGLNENTKIVLTVGYVDHRKGVDLFVECALNILAKRTDVDFIWVGHWAKDMEQEVETWLLLSPYKDHIHFVGYNPDTALFHAASDVYALTSREDPFPNVVLESFDAGVPVVAFTGTGGAARLVEQVGGIVAPSLNTAKLSDAICQLLDSTVLSSTLGEMAQRYVDEHFAFRPYLFELCTLLDIDLPKISVVVPNYNYAQYIEERLASICNQSIPIFELIILDDASTDQSIAKISDWLALARTDARIVVNQINSGNVFSQWQKGISLATGDYVWIAEADDLSDLDFLETVMPPLISGNAVISYCDSQQINSSGKVQAKNYQEYLSAVSRERWKNAYITSGVEECQTSLAVLNTIPNVSAVVFNRETISKVFSQHYDEITRFKKAGDWVAYLHALSFGDIAYSPRAANLHRRHEQSVIGEGSRQSLIQEIITVQEMITNMYKLSDEVQKKALIYRQKLSEMVG